ncbi:MAG: hypothetical protein ACLFUG_04215 [Nitriliruptoraceae bacterium]
MTDLIARARTFLGRGLEEVQALLGPGAEPIPGDEYGRLTDLTSIEDPTVFPGTLYLADGVVDLVRVGPDDLVSVSRSDLESQLGGDAVGLASRAGKRATLWVHAPEGVAYSEEDGVLHYLEVFRPRPQERYEAELYREPGPFLR